ncbi:MAG: arsenate reductase [Methylotenera sp.]|nr:arsenate reductase [Methylotenera sp.]PPC87359.1 MAG: arsenate reductase [Methylotenera sp.]PPD55112.1 MAG: arsenate reductase [Methylotenera sp.]
MKLYGIPNCNTVKKARDWLAAHHISVEFHDFKKQGISAADLTAWLAQIPHEKLINRAGLTWRGLDEQTKNSIVDDASAIALMQNKTSVIKRPILVKDGTILCVGFDETRYAALFNQSK